MVFNMINFLNSTLQALELLILSKTTSLSILQRGVFPRMRFFSPWLTAVFFLLLMLRYECTVSDSIDRYGFLKKCLDNGKDIVSLSNFNDSLSQ